MIDSYFVSSKIYWHPEGCLKARILNVYVELTSTYDTVVVFCGNKIWGQTNPSPVGTAVFPVQVATTLH